MNDLADKQMMTHNGEWEGGRMKEGRKDCIEGNKGWEGWWGMEKITMNQKNYPM